MYAPFSLSLFLYIQADDIEFDAQVPAEIPSGARQRHLEAAVQHVSHLRIQGDRVHRGDRLSK